MKGIKTYYIDGNTTASPETLELSSSSSNMAETRDNLVSNFSNDKENHIFIVSEAGGTGTDFRCLAELYVVMLPQSIRDLYQWFGRAKRRNSLEGCDSNVGTPVNLNILSLVGTGVPWDDMRRFKNVQSNAKSLRKTLGAISKYCICKENLDLLAQELDSFLPGNPTQVSCKATT